MTKLAFGYSMKMEYGAPVTKCYFTMKCLPQNTARQEVGDLSVELLPPAVYSYGQDGFGNRKLYGKIEEAHEEFELKVSGQVTITQVLYEELADAAQTMIYKQASAKTKAGARILAYKEELLARFPGMKGVSKLSDYNLAFRIMHDLYGKMHYEAGVTDVNTSAEEAFAARRGVCQDYAHIFITLCRLCGIPARYAAGLMIGEGASHAWAEIFYHGRWIGMDPTNDLLIDDNYIKFCHGRDAGDCKINLGIVLGGGKQAQVVKASVRKIIEE